MLSIELYPLGQLLFSSLATLEVERQKTIDCPAAAASSSPPRHKFISDFRFPSPTLSNYRQLEIVSFFFEIRDRDTRRRRRFMRWFVVDYAVGGHEMNLFSARLVVEWLATVLMAIDLGASRGINHDRQSDAPPQPTNSWWNEERSIVMARVVVITRRRVGHLIFGALPKRFLLIIVLMGFFCIISK